jgi:ribonuclease HI
MKIPTLALQNPTPDYGSAFVFRKKAILFFDGCCKGNPGPGGSGFVLYEEDGATEIVAAAQFVGDYVTNNVAEYNGLICGLKEAVKQGVEDLVVKGDSLLIIQQMRKEFQIRSSNLLPFYQEAAAIVKEFAKIEFKHVYRAENQRADALSNQGVINEKRVND